LNERTTLFESAEVVKMAALHKIVDKLDTIDATTTAVVQTAGLQTGTTPIRATTLSSSRPQASKCRVSMMAVFPWVVTKDQRLTSSTQEAIPRGVGTVAEAANERQSGRTSKSLKDRKWKTLSGLWIQDWMSWVTSVRYPQYFSQ
jgi:hypothetical protein